MKGVAFFSMHFFNLIVIASFIEVPNRISKLHIIETLKISHSQCRIHCEKDSFCQGYTQIEGECTTYFYLPQFVRQASKHSLFLKKSVTGGAFNKGSLIMRRSSFESCNDNICSYDGKQKLVASNRSSKVLTNLTAKFENLPFVSTPSQYWRNVTDNTTILECLSQCDSYTRCLAVQYIFNNTFCAMLDVWPGDFYEIDRLEAITSVNLDAELFLKIDFIELGYSITDKHPPLHKRALDVPVNECMNKCTNIPDCEGFYYNELCNLVFNNETESIPNIMNGIYFERIISLDNGTNLSILSTFSTEKSTNIYGDFANRHFY